MDFEQAKTAHTSTVNFADDSSFPASVVTTTLYVPVNSNLAESITSFISLPSNDILYSDEDVITVVSLREQKIEH